jgi:hypothetical protein
MPRIGVTGHMDLTPDTADLVYREIRALLADYPPQDLTGVSCLARGADSLFAEAVLDVGGRLVVILPSDDYREAKVKNDHAERFDRLLAGAHLVSVMPFANASREAYEVANTALVESCDQLVAVWDGAPSNGRGGTADVVRRAREHGTPVTVVWPNGARRG